MESSNASVKKRVREPSPDPKRVREPSPDPVTQLNPFFFVFDLAEIKQD